MANTASGKHVRRLLGGSIPQDVVDGLEESLAAASTDGLRLANAQTADYTLALSDLGKAVDVNSATAKNVTVPPNSTAALPLGSIIEVHQVGAGAVTLVAGAGVTLEGDLTTPAQRGSLLLRKRATNTWAVTSLAPSGTYPENPLAPTPAIGLVTQGHAANSIPAAGASGAVADLAVAASRFVGRRATGDVGVLTANDANTLLYGVDGAGRIWYDVASFGAVGDNGTDSTAAIQAAINAANTAAAPFGAVVYFPPGRYVVNPGAANTPLVFPANARNITFKAGGPGQPGADGTLIRNGSTSGSPMFLFPVGTATRLVFDGLRIRQGATAGPIFDAVTNAALFIYCQWRNCSLDQQNPGVPVFDSAATEMYSCLMEMCDLNQAANATVPFWRMIGIANSISNNIFDGRGGRWTGATGATAPCFHLENQNTGFNYDNVFANWCLETPAGGFLKLLSAANTLVEQNGVFDLQVSGIGAHIYIVDKSAVGGGTASRQTTFRKCLRRSGGAMGAWQDIKLVSFGANDTVIEECNGAIDLGSNSGLTLRSNHGASSSGGSVGTTFTGLPAAYTEITRVGGGMFTDLKTPAIATASLPAAAAAQNGRIIIEDAGAGDRNLIIYAGGQRFRIDGGASF